MNMMLRQIIGGPRRCLRRHCIPAFSSSSSSLGYRRRILVPIHLISQCDINISSAQTRHLVVVGSSCRPPLLSSSLTDCENHRLVRIPSHVSSMNMQRQSFATSFATTTSSSTKKKFQKPKEKTKMKRTTTSSSSSSRHRKSKTSSFYSSSSSSSGTRSDRRHPTSSKTCKHQKEVYYGAMPTKKSVFPFDPSRDDQNDVLLVRRRQQQQQQHRHIANSSITTAIDLLNDDALPPPHCVALATHWTSKSVSFSSVYNFPQHDNDDGDQDSDNGDDNNNNDHDDDSLVDDKEEVEELNSTRDGDEEEAGSNDNSEDDHDEIDSEKATDEASTIEDRNRFTTTGASIDEPFESAVVAAKDETTVVAAVGEASSSPSSLESNLEVDMDNCIYLGSDFCRIDTNVTDRDGNRVACVCGKPADDCRMHETHRERGDPRNPIGYYQPMQNRKYGFRGHGIRDEYFSKEEYETIHCSGDQQKDQKELVNHLADKGKHEVEGSINVDDVSLLEDGRPSSVDNQEKMEVKDIMIDEEEGELTHTEQVSPPEDAVESSIALNEYNVDEEEKKKTDAKLVSSETLEDMAPKEIFSVDDDTNRTKKKVMWWQSSSSTYTK